MLALLQKKTNFKPVFSLKLQWNQISKILAQLTNTAADIQHQNKPAMVPLLMSLSRFTVPKGIFTAVSLLQQVCVCVTCIKVQVVQRDTTTPDKMSTFSLSLRLLYREDVRSVTETFRNFPICALWSSTPFTIYENMALRLYFLKDCSLLLNDGCIS